MPKAEFIRARVDETLKANTELLFARLGLNMTDAITLFLTQCELRQGLPFDVKIPTTGEKMLDAIKRKNIPHKAVEVNKEGHIIVDKDKDPDLYNWAVNG
jgi:DNA-damage-inducible protein J